jgi:TP901 family phage tail tape measure protein
MSDEIVNKLGFDVAQALSALQQLDNQLQTSGTVLQAHATQLNAWNSQAQVALATMQALASASSKIGAMPTAVSPITAPAATSLPGSTQALLYPGGQTQVTQTIQAMNTLTTASAVAGTTISNAGNQAANALAGANKSAKNFTISLSMMGRIIITQLIVRSLSQIRDALREAVESAIEFQRAISEVMSIAPLTDTFQTLQDEAAELSKKFNIPLPQVAEGLYQTISDQFTSVTERTDIMQAAMMLARVGVMDLGDSVKLLTGTLNAYGMASSEAMIVAAKFFETIKLGRVRGKELSDTIGQVIPIAAQVGVSLDEVAAAYVSMTIGGLDAHKSATGLRQAMVAFLKPSEDMKKVLRELGYSNAEQIIQAEGFMGALQSVGDASRNMASEIGKSFRNVRALTAELSLTRDGAKKYQEAMVAMGEVSTESLKKLYNEFRSMPAEAVTAEINKLKVAMTRDFGNMMVGILGTILQFVGGADRLAAALQGLTVVAVVLGVALAALAVKALLAQAALGPIGWTLLAVGAALTTIAALSAYTGAMDVAQVRNAADARREASLERLKATEEALRQESELGKKLRDEADRAQEQGVTLMRKRYFNVLDTLKETNASAVEDSRATMSSMISAQERVVAAYRNAANAAVNAVRESRERQTATEAAYSDEVFKYARKNDSAYDKSENYMRRARQLSKEAGEAMRAAKTPEEITAAQAIYQRADAAAEQALQIAGGTKNIILQGDAERNVLSVMKQKVAAEKALQEIQAKAAAALAVKAAAETGRLNEQKILMKAILADLEAFDKKGPKEPAILKAQSERLETNMKRFQELWLGGAGGIDVSNLLSMDKLQQRVSLAVTGGVKAVEVQKLFAAPGTFESFRSDIEKGVGPIKAYIQYATAALPPDLRELVKESTAEESVSLISQRLQQTNETLGRYKDLSNSLKVANDTLDETMGRGQALVRDYVASLPPLLTFQGALRPGRRREAREAIDTLDKQIARFTMMPRGQFNEKDFKDLNTAYQKYMQLIRPPKATGEILARLISEASQVASATEQVSKLRGGLREQEKAAAQAAAERPGLQEAYRAAKEIEDAARRAKEEAAGAKGEVTAVSQINMTSLTTQTNGAAEAMWNLAMASMAVKTPVTSIAEVAAMGGRVGRYLAGGGPVGTDVVPAWLTRGEFVMNTEATRQFASQLVAMNAGVQPISRGGGGSVTNIGDISVSVQGGATGRQTARSIATELRRELRRGTVKPL